MAGVSMVWEEVLARLRSGSQLTDAACDVVDAKRRTILVVGLALLAAACSPQPVPRDGARAAQAKVEDARLRQLVIARFTAIECGPSRPMTCESARVNCIRDLPLTEADGKAGVSRKVIAGATYAFKPAPPGLDVWQTAGFLREYTLAGGRWAQTGDAVSEPQAYDINCIGSVDHHGAPIPLEGAL
jgi:hypothetical protein